MEATKCTEILEQALLLFINDVYSEGHKFMADSDPKHTCTSLYDWNCGTCLKKWRRPLETLFRITFAAQLPQIGRLLVFLASGISSIDHACFYPNVDSLKWRVLPVSCVKCALNNSLHSGFCNFHLCVKSGMPTVSTWFEKFNYTLILFLLHRLHNRLKRKPYYGQYLI